MTLKSKRKKKKDHRRKKILHLQRIAITHPLVNLSLWATETSEKKLIFKRILIHNQSAKEALNHGYASTEKAMRYSKQLKRFLDGKKRKLSLPIDLSSYTRFRKKVLLTLQKKVPWGRTVSYQQLARMAGHPKAIRAVASTVRDNDFPLIIPCHRVIRSDGSIGGFMGALKGKPIELKRKLLKNEGVRLSQS